MEEGKEMEEIEMRDPYKDDNDDYDHFVKRPRLEECARDACVSHAQRRRQEYLKKRIADNRLT